MARLAGTPRRFLIGLALAAAAALAVEHLVLIRAGQSSAGQQASRQAIVAVQALTELVSRLGGEGETVARAVASFSARDEVLTSVRVVHTGNRSLEASTFPEDTGDKAAPRRLAREEKPYFDQANTLRQAVETNRQEGVYREAEIEIGRAEDGSLTLAAPVEVGGELVGAVLATAVSTPRTGAPLAEAPPAPHRPGLALPLGLLFGVVALFAVLALVLPENRWLLGAVAALLLIGAVGVDAWQGLAGITASQQASELAVARVIAATDATARAVVAQLGAPETGLAGWSPDPTTWDSDLYRRPLGRIDASGALVPAVFEARMAGVEQRLKQVILGILAVGLTLLFFTGFGGAARLGHTLSTHRWAYFYILPAILAMLVLVFFPFAYGIALSFTGSTLYNEDQPLLEKWTGFDNYVDILGDTAVLKKTAEGGYAYNYENFYWTLGFTILWTVANVAFGVTVGLILALILNARGLALRPIYRVLLILPWAVPNYITALIWKGMFHRQLGVVNQVLQIFGGEAISWFESPFTSFLAIWATNSWLSFPFMMVISLGALQSIPSDLYEAARVDGASRWQQFRAITLPSLRPALIPAIILSVIWTFNMFNIPYLTSVGEPAHATEILITGAYKIAFEKYQYGYAAAYATIIFLILLVYGTWQNKVTGATEAIG